MYYLCGSHLLPSALAKPLIINASRTSFDLLAATDLDLPSFDTIMCNTKQTLKAERSNCVNGLALHISLVS